MLYIYFEIKFIACEIGEIKMLIVKLPILLIFLFTVAMVFLGMRTPEDKRPPIKPIVSLNAIPEAIGRAVETGRPIHFTVGSAWRGAAPENIAGIALLSSIAQESERLGGHLIATVCNPVLIPLHEEAMKAGVILAGGDPSNIDVRFISPYQFPYVTGVMGLLERENVGAQFLLGADSADVLMYLETGHRVGAMQISGSIGLWNMPFMATVSDYTMIGEEFLAAAAVVSKDPVQIGSLYGQDLSKILIVIIMILGAILAQMGSSILVNLLAG
jgi:hypothetical protein